MFNLAPSVTALLFIDPQNDFLSEGGVMWDVVGEGVKKTKVVDHLVELRNAAAVVGVPVFYSPHHAASRSQNQRRRNPSGAWS